MFKEVTLPYMSAGERFGRWVVLEDAAMSKDQILCRCDCGTEKLRYALSLKHGKSRSCGCLKSDILVARNVTHGLTAHPLYGTWLHMIHRCTRPDSPNWADYGGRGIRVCDRWLGDAGVANFIADMGPRPTPRHSLDRIDNSTGYEPGNCAWVTKGEQSRNTRPKIRNAKYGSVLDEIERLRRLVLDLGGDPGAPYRAPTVEVRNRSKGEE